MQRINRARRNRQPPAAIGRSPGRNESEFIEISALSLAGLAVTLFLIAQYAGSGVLQQMFAL